jgi:hypothetical protein
MVELIFNGKDSSFWSSVNQATSHWVVFNVNAGPGVGVGEGVGVSLGSAQIAISVRSLSIVTAIIADAGGAVAGTTPPHETKSNRHLAVSKTTVPASYL